MSELIVTVLPVAIGSAVVPVHILVSVLLLQGRGGRGTAAAWIAGQATTRLVQGVVFGLILAPIASDDPAVTTPILSTVLLIVSLLLLIMAVRALVKEADEDAPPPAWVTMLESLGRGRSYVIGAAIVAIGPKFGVFTLGAIAAIDVADLQSGQAVAAFLVFVALASSVQLALLVAAFVAPATANAASTGLVALLTTYGRPIKVGLGFAFGAWFLVKALDGLGVL